MTEGVQSGPCHFLASENFPALRRQIWQDAVDRWKEPHRRWHDLQHLESLLGLIEADNGLLAPDKEMLRYVALFHDAVYDPFSSNNEEESAQLAAQGLSDYDRKEEVVGLILATKNHQSKDDLAQKFNQWDCAILSESRWDKLMTYEQGIAFEYRAVDPEVYRRERGRFLRSAAKDYRNPFLERLANEVDPQ